MFGLYSAFKHMGEQKKAAKLAAVGHGSSKKTWIYDYFGDELGNVFVRELDRPGGKKGKLDRVSKGAYPIVQKVADEPVKIATMHAFLKGQPEVKKL